MGDVENKTEQLEQINEVRHSMGMPEINYKERTCLRCDESFISAGIHNRLCDVCRKKNEGIDRIPQEVERYPVKGQMVFSKKINDGY